MRSTDFGAPGSWHVVVLSSFCQAVQISFSPQWIFFAGDSGNGTVWVLDLQHLQPIWAATNYHATMPVPGGSSGDAFYRNAFYGSVDAATGVYYASTTQGTSSGGNTKGLFALPAVGGELQFVDFNASGTEVFIAGGRVWSGPTTTRCCPRRLRLRRCRPRRARRPHLHRSPRLTSQLPSRTDRTRSREGNASNTTRRSRMLVLRRRPRRSSGTSSPPVSPSSRRQHLRVRAPKRTEP